MSRIRNGGGERSDGPRPDDYLQRILTSRVYDIAEETPLEQAPKLSARLGGPLLLKREDMQSIFSFKIRGAYNKMALLDPEARAAGVVAASAGNHAQGVAVAARALGCRATIVMPVTTPDIKVAAVRAAGAEVVLYGDAFAEAEGRAFEIQHESRATFVHPYDDPDVIAGQGTVGLEIVRQAPRDLAAVFVPVGGGGLIAGVGSVLKRVLPDVRVIGVEPDDSDAMRRSLEAGHRVELENVGLFADGVAVRRVGVETLRVCREVVDEIVTVDTDAICAAIKDVFEDTRTVLEPAGALSVAGAKAYLPTAEWSERPVIAIASGANMNFDRLRHVSERAEIGEHREAVLAVTIPERPGSFREFCRRLGARNVTEFNYRFAGTDDAHVFVGVQVGDRDEARALVADLCRGGIEALDLTDDEMSKLHLRHLVGGRAGGLANERVYRFEFPERPGALMRFLDAMALGWNISLFHYRNHGADYGRVLVGVQVPEEELPKFRRALGGLGYVHREETDNPAYRLFVR